MTEADKAAFEMWETSTPELKFRFEHGSLLMKNTAFEAWQAALAHRDAQLTPVARVAGAFGGRYTIHPLVSTVLPEGLALYTKGFK